MALTPRGSKDKGSKYERELADYLNSKIEGLTVKRALLSGGGVKDGDADLTGTPLIHVEAKRTETFAPKAAMRQAEATIARKKNVAMPVVINRTNGMATGESLVVMRLDDWIAFYEAMLS